MQIARIRSSRARLLLVLLALSGSSLACDDLGRSGEALAALRVAKDEALSDADALEKIVLECIDKFARAKVQPVEAVETGWTLRVDSSVSAWGQGAVGDFVDGTQRRLGERALYSEVAGEQRGLRELRMVHRLAEEKVVMYQVLSTVSSLDRAIVSWRKKKTIWRWRGREAGAVHTGI